MTSATTPDVGWELWLRAALRYAQCERPGPEFLAALRESYREGESPDTAVDNWTDMSKE